MSPPVGIRAIYFDLSDVVTAESLTNDLDTIQLDRHPAIDVLTKDLRAKGILAGILSNMTTSNRNRLSIEGAFDGFNPVLLSCDVGSDMPDKAIYNHALQSIGYPKANVLLVSSSVKHLEPAFELGMQVMQAEGPEQVAAELGEMMLHQPEARL